jgi:hypothetical protein
MSVKNGFERRFNDCVKRRTKQNNDDAYPMLAKHVVGDAANGDERPAESVAYPSLTSIMVLGLLLLFVAHNTLEVYLFKARRSTRSGASTIARES